MQVAEVMTPVSVSDSPGQTLRAAAAQMWRAQTGSLLVMEYGRLLGIVTERDLLRAVATGGDLDGTVVGDVMTADVYTVVPETPIYEAARQMAARWIRHLPVMAPAPADGAGTVVGACRCGPRRHSRRTRPGLRRGGVAERRARALPPADPDRARGPRLTGAAAGMATPTGRHPTSHGWCRTAPTRTPIWAGAGYPSPTTTSASPANVRRTTGASRVLRADGARP